MTLITDDPDYWDPEFDASNAARWQDFAGDTVSMGLASNLPKVVVVVSHSVSDLTGIAVHKSSPPVRASNVGTNFVGGQEQEAKKKIESVFGSADGDGSSADADQSGVE